ncbi:hypothetical protein AGMMS49938_13410 [Fibrobacterales bacterium]|nr:hypothetical protein AGMMS49938_13410 [Fibrobacterales bacterium]
MKQILVLIILGIFALFLVTVFLINDKTPQDSLKYITENMNCNENPNHAESRSLVKCIWNLENPYTLPSDSAFYNMVKFLSERHPEEYPLRLHKIFFYNNATGKAVENAVAESLVISGKNLNILKVKNSVWKNVNTDCEFPNFCPQKPLQDSLVFAVAAGRILEVDSVVKIYHGKNIYSTTTGFERLNDSLQVGKLIDENFILGYISQGNTATVQLEINGKLTTQPLVRQFPLPAP